jgi:biofilm PGA synthesis N-glycosyltransferase PgaC
MFFDAKQMPSFPRLSTRSYLLIFFAYSITITIAYLAFTQTDISKDHLLVLRTVIFFLILPVAVKFITQLAVAPFSEWITSLKLRKFHQSSPRVSILIPAWNEEVGILKTLNSVISANYPDFEVIVINDGSTDNTHQIIRDFLATADCPKYCSLKYLKLKNGGKAQALNKALTYATGEIIITIDADSIMHPDAITHITRQFCDPAVAAVAGNVSIGNRFAGLGIIQQLEYLFGFYMKRADSVFNAVYIIGGAAAAYRTSTLIDVGGFDCSVITEDIELSTRMLSHGYKCRYEPKAIVYTEGPSDIRSLCNQRLRWKYGRFQTFYKYRSLFFNSQHSKNHYLSWLLLPTALYAELLLLCEIPLLTLFFSYVALSGDFISLLIAISFISCLISVQMFSDYQRNYHKQLIWLAPIAWLIWYIVDAVELSALIRSLKRFHHKKNVQWQKWNRTGIDV